MRPIIIVSDRDAFARGYHEEMARLRQAAREGRRWQ